jgi:organic hydroperoxide reductase OsmC/OhrA
MVNPVHEFTISMDQVRDYEFRIKFDKAQFAELQMDEPPPLGRDSGPSASRILAAAIGNCLSASLLFCARKAGARIDSIHTEVKVQIVRNENKRLRVGRVEVTIDPKVAEADKAKALDCLPRFEDFCTVTQSIRQGIDVEVRVKGVE